MNETDEAERQELREAIDDLMSQPVAPDYSPRLPAWVAD